MRILDLAARHAGVPDEYRGSKDALICVASMCMEQMEAMIPLWRMFKCRPEARAEQIREWTTQDEDGEVYLLEFELLDMMRCTRGEELDGVLGQYAAHIHDVIGRRVIA